jgi:hypothetical protein
MLQLFFMPSDYCAMLLWWVFFVTLDVRPSDGLWHGQEHGQANKQGIRSSKIGILAISASLVMF